MFRNAFATRASSPARTRYCANTTNAIVSLSWDRRRFCPDLTGLRNDLDVHLRLRRRALTSTPALPRMTTAAPDRPACGFGGVMLEVRDPADVRSIVGEAPAMTAGDVAAAYARARAGFEAWRHAGALDRAAVLSRCADLIRARADDGAVTLVRENGKTLAEARV